MTEESILDKLEAWLLQPTPRHPDVVNKPDKLFRYHGGYKMFRGQKPRRVNVPAVRVIALPLHSAHP